MKTAKTKTKKTKTGSKTKVKKPSVETKSSEELEILKIKKTEFIPKCFTGIVEWENGNKYWFSKGFYHRLDGPAVEQGDGSKEWWVNGKLHRKDGPAIEFYNGTKEWWIEDKRYSEEDFKKEIEKRNQEKQPKPQGENMTKTLKIKALKDIQKKFTGIVEWPSGIKEWRKDGLLHREDGHAVEYPNGEKLWFLDNKGYYKEDFKKEIERRNLEKQPKPQGENMMKTLKLKSWELIPVKFTGIIEFYNGSKAWYKEGKYHRLDGPAIERADGDKEWCIEGKRHRLDGPAIEKINGTKIWYVENEHHRIDGPAIEWSDGSKEWWIEGERYYSEEDFKKEIKRRNQETENKPIEIVSENKVEITNMENRTIALKISLPKNFPTEIKIDLREIKLAVKTLIIKLEQKDS